MNGDKHVPKWYVWCCASRARASRADALRGAQAQQQPSTRTARQVRDSLLNLPDRLAAELAAETNQFKVHQRLVKEIRRALEELQFFSRETRILGVYPTATFRKEQGAGD